MKFIIIIIIILCLLRDVCFSYSQVFKTFFLSKLSILNSQFHPYIFVENSNSSY